MRPFIVVGDRTSHGGVVITGSPFTDVDGKDVSRIGDKATCPRCKRVVTIVTGDLTDIIDGQPVARHGDKTDCGAMLISSQMLTYVDDSSGNSQAASSTVSQGSGVQSNLANDEKHPQYDEALQLLGKDGVPIANLAYKIYSGNALLAQGKSDSNGLTSRIATEQPEEITKVLVEPEKVFCCAAALEHATGTSGIEVEISGVQTNPNQVGASVAKVTVETKERPMTAGEVDMCKLIFKDAIDYAKVKIHKGSFMPGAGGNAMTPFGEPHFPVFENGSGYQDDFSEISDINLKVWFIHEMVHVWQYQLGYSVATHGAWISIKGGYAGTPPAAYKYDYNSSSQKDISEYNMEQQGDIISHYYARAFLNSNNPAHRASFEFNSKALKKFLENPKDEKLLPSNTNF